MKSFQVDPRIAHLDAAKLSALTNRYHAGERVRDLIAEFRIVCAPNQLYRLLPPRLLPDRYCLVCGAPLAQLRPSRPGASVSSTVGCTACAHRVEGYCECAACARARRDERQREIALRRAEYQAHCRALLKCAEELGSLSEIGLTEAIALLSVVRCGGWRENGAIGAIKYSAVRLAPSGRLGGELLSVLIKAGLLAPDPDSPVDTLRTTDETLEDFLIATHWRVLTPSPTSLVRHIECVAESGEWPEGWIDELGDVQTVLALEECREFAAYCLMERGFPEAPDVASEVLYRNLLSDFSVAQCFRIIWAGAHATSDFLLRKQTNRRHAANYFVGACQRWADRARAEGWTIKPGFRNQDCPRSQLSYVLYDVFLGIGEKGFLEPLGLRSG